MSIQTEITHLPQRHAEGLRGPWHRVHDYLAPDGSKFWVISQTTQAGLGFCELPAEGVSTTARHQTVEEIWQFVQGQGRVRRSQGGSETVDDVCQGSVLIIRPNVEFQFRTIGDEPLRFFVVTTPPWPGPQEAVLCPDQGWRK